MFLGVSAKLWVALCVTLLASMGLSLPYPVLTPLFIDAPITALNSYGGWSGATLLTTLLAIYPLGIFIGSSFIGALSDRYGRRKVLAQTLIVCFFGYLVSAYALIIEDYMLLLISRFLTGITEGNVAIARAIALDIGKESANEKAKAEAKAKEEKNANAKEPTVFSQDALDVKSASPPVSSAQISSEKVRAVSLINSAVFTGWLLGPLIGGALGVFGASWAMFAAAVASFLCVVLVWLVLIETNKTQVSIKMSIWQSIVKENSLRLLADPWMRKLFYMYFIYTLAMNLYYEFYPIWLVDKHGYSSLGIGLATTHMTLYMTLASIFLVTWVQRKFGFMTPMTRSILMLSVLLFCVPFTDGWAIHLVFALSGIFIATFNGLLPVFISDNQPDRGNGAAMGLLTTTFCIANVFAAIAGGLLLQMDSNWPLFLASGLYLVVLFLLDRFFIKGAKQSTIPP